jgi:lipoyl(octanoyl) transferase
MKSDVDKVHVPIFTELDVYYDFTFRSAAANMAIDETLLEVVTIPSIRFYRWNSPALSFGYFGKFADIADYATERDLVRRWTGGGIVFHGDDLTYSIVIPASDPIFGESSMSIYEKIHRALCNALIATGQRALVAGIVDPAAAVTDASYNGQCFGNPVRADVMVNGRKVAGAAHRRTRASLLHQGSIQLATRRVRPTGGRVDLGNDLAERFAGELAEVCDERSLTTRIEERASEIAQQKYGTQNWLQRR